MATRTNAPERLILTIPEAAEHCALHRDTVRRACETGALHGMQRMKGAPWRIRISCLEKWLEGEICGHQKDAA